jgi:hypothetical protein
MPKFTKKPIVIEALQWDGDRHRTMFDFLGGDPNKSMDSNGEHFYIDHDKVVGGLVIKTLWGEQPAKIGDWIIKGETGRYYPCSPDAFHQTYEPVVEEIKTDEEYTPPRILITATIEETKVTKKVFGKKVKIKIPRQAIAVDQSNHGALSSPAEFSVKPPPGIRLEGDGPAFLGVSVSTPKFKDLPQCLDGAIATFRFFFLLDKGSRKYVCDDYVDVEVNASNVKVTNNQPQ